MQGDVSSDQNPGVFYSLYIGDYIIQLYKLNHKLYAYIFGIPSWINPVFGFITPKNAVSTNQKHTENKVEHVWKFPGWYIFAGLHDG